jgi:pyruvate kinase
MKHSFDYVTIPSVQSGRDLQEVKLLMGPEAKNMQIIAKIDTLDAIQNFSSILKQADGVIILREELMIELEPEKLILA